jgi:hypothetical protein
MAGFISLPTTKQGCYQSLVFEYSHTIVGNSNRMSIEVDVLINSNSFRTLYLNTYSSVTEVSGDYVYTFDIDISKIVQSFFNNIQFFYDTSKTYPYTDACLTADVALDVYRYEPDANGILTRNTSATRSNNRLFFNSLKNDFSDYTASSGRKFITKNTDYRLSSEVTNLLAAYSDVNANVINIVNETTLVVTNVNMTDDQINIINLNDYFSNGDSQLTVSLGTLDGVDFTITGQQIRYDILDNKCESIGLHFQSELGVSEVFIFKTYEYEISKSRETELYVSSNDLERMYSGKIDKSINIERNGFFTAEWLFFSDVITSSIFYIEQTTGALNEAFSTFNNLPYRTISNQIDVNLSFTYSDKQKIFSN